MKTKEEILEGHFGSDYWMNTSLQYILRAMDEYADQFKQSHKPVVVQGLPSLEEIDSVADSVSLRARPNESRYDMYRGFQLGARWMKSKMSTEEQTGSPAVGQRSVDTVNVIVATECLNQNERGISSSQ